MVTVDFLPKGLRLEVIDNDNLRVPVGTKATIVWDCRDSSPMVMIDGDSMASCLPLAQCKIIVEK